MNQMDDEIKEKEPEDGSYFDETEPLETEKISKEIPDAKTPSYAEDTYDETGLLDEDDAEALDEPDAFDETEALNEAVEKIAALEKKNREEKNAGEAEEYDEDAYADTDDETAPTRPMPLLPQTLTDEVNAEKARKKEQEEAARRRAEEEEADEYDDSPYGEEEELSAQREGAAKNAPLHEPEDAAPEEEEGDRDENGRRKNAVDILREENEKKHRKPANLILDAAIVAVGLAAAAFMILFGVRYSQNRAVEQEIETFASLGENFPESGSIGSAKVAEISGVRAEKLAALKAAEEEAARKKAEEEAANAKEKKSIELHLSTIMSDLKIKFVNTETGQVETDVPWICEVTDPSGKKTQYVNDDLDGIIYKKDLAAGTYSVAMVPFEKTDENYKYYSFSTDPESIIVKDKIAYEKVDVSDEIKDTSQVNVAAEDTGHTKEAAAPVEVENGDTVEFVESTKTEVGADEDGISSNEDTYEEVTRDNVADPSASARLTLPEASGNRYIDGIRRLGMVASTEPLKIGMLADNEDGSEESTEDSGEESQEDSGEDAGEQEAAPAGVTKVSIDGGNQTSRSTEVSLHASVTADRTDVSFSWSVTSGNAVLSSAYGQDVKLTFTGSESESATVEVTASGSDGTSATASAVISYNAAKTTAVITAIPSTVKLSVGGTKQLSVTVGSSDGGKLNDQSVTYSSSDSSIATVSSGGNITAVAAGSCKITIARSSDSSISTEVTVTVSSNSAALKDKDGNQLYVKNADGTYRAATADDYYTDVTLYKLVSGTKKYRYTGWQDLDGKTYFFDKDGNKVTGKQTIQGVEYTFGSDGALQKESSSSKTLGIDVSQWNGSIDWNAVKNSGVNFVIIRCGYRGSSTGAMVRDPNFASNIKGAKAAGLKVGVYFFTQAINEVEAVEEASMVLSVISGYGLDYPVYLDIESSGGRADSISYSTRTAVAKAFCATIANSGYKAGVYANQNWMSSMFNAAALTNYSIWLAQYAAAPTYTTTRYDIWQYSSAGHINGISGYVDMDTKN